MTESYELHTLSNGVRIITQEVPGLRSAALGIWIGTGSRHEAKEECGSAHFIEHMSFKGTDRRTAQQLAQEMDSIGGQINAFTTKESTCFYGRCLDSHLGQITDMLWDMVFCSRFDQAEVDHERGVILEEIKMYEDDPQDLCDQRLMAAVYEGSSLARPILGKKKTLKAMTGEGLKAYQKAHYQAEDIVVSLAGSFGHLAVEELKARFMSLPTGKQEQYQPAIYTPAFTLKKKPIEQNHLSLAFEGLPFGDTKRFQLQLLSTILGSGMSSRLWQELREKRGLCYSVYSYGAGHEETGVFGVYTALSKETEAKALQTIWQVVTDFADHGPTAEELVRACEQSKANVLMGLESTQSRMSHLGRSILHLGRPMSTEEVVAAYDAVTKEQVRDLAQQIVRPDLASLSVVGTVGKEAEYRKLLGRVE